MLALKSKVRPDRRGATIVLIAILMPVLVVMVVLAIEIGRMYLVRAQLQTAVDAGALAAGLQLRENPDNVNDAVKKGLKFVQLNRAGAFVEVPKDAVAIEPGSWDPATRVFTPGTAFPDAIQVSATLDQEPFFFAKALEFHTFAMPRSAIAIAGGRPLDIIMTLDFGVHGIPRPHRSAAKRCTNLHRESQGSWRQRSRRRDGLRRHDQQV